MSTLDVLIIFLVLLAAISADKPVLVVVFTVLAVSITVAKEIYSYYKRLIYKNRNSTGTKAKSIKSTERSDPHAKIPSAC